MATGSPFLTVFEMGPLESEHSVKLFNKLVVLVLGVLLVGAGLAAALFAVISAIGGFSQGAGYALGTACVPGAVSAAALALGGWSLFAAYRDWGSAVAVFHDGLAVAKWEDVRQIPWEEVTHVWQNITKHYTNGIYTGTTYKYTVQLVDDTKYTFDTKYKNIEALGKTIQTNVTQRLYPKYFAALKAGSRLEFGPLAMDYNKLFSGKKELNWDQVQSVRIQDGYVSVKQEKGWFHWASIGVPQIPNFFVLYGLLKEFRMVE